MIRLACIDAPEFQQTGGIEATQRLRQLTPIGSTVQIFPRAIDQYNRVVAVVFGKNNKGGKFNVNLQMVSEGQAVVYQQYLNNCPGSRQDLLRAEAYAKNMALGFWSQTNCLPSEFRRGECDNGSRCVHFLPRYLHSRGFPGLGLW